MASKNPNDAFRVALRRPIQGDSARSARGHYGWLTGCARWRNRLIIGLTLTVCFVDVGMSQSNDPATRVSSSTETFLNEFGLDRLLVTYQETQAGGSASAIKRLQRSYTRELFKPVSDEVWSKRLLTNAKRFLLAHSNQESQQLRLAIAHRELELHQSAYLIGKSDVDFGPIVGELILLRRGLTQQVQNLQRLFELRQTAVGDNVLLDQRRQQLRHGEFLQGWVYYLQSAAKMHQDRQLLRDAESFFRSYLELEPYLNLTKISALKFGQRDRFRRSAIVGLAMAMQAIGADAQANHCFSIVRTHEKSTDDMRAIEDVTRWQFVGLLERRDFIGAKRLLPFLDKNVLSGFILNRAEMDTELVSLAFTELALDFNASQLRNAIRRFPDTLKQQPDLENWILGCLAWDDFQTNDGAGSLEQAITKLQAAIESFDGQVHQEIQGHCRFLLASCRRVQGHYSDAIDGFLTSATLLGQRQRSLAAEAIYNAWVTVRLVPVGQRQQPDTLALRLVSDFPQSRFAELAMFQMQLDRLKNKSSDAAFQFLGQCRSVDWPDAVVAMAAVEMAKQFRWSDGVTVRDFREFIEALSVDDRINDESKIEARHQFVSALLGRDDALPYADTIDEQLGQVERLLNSNRQIRHRGLKAVMQIYYRTLVLLDRQPIDQTQAFEYFQFLESLDVRSPWTLATLIQIARCFENVSHDRLCSDRSLRKQMIAVYHRLSMVQRSKGANDWTVSAPLYVGEDGAVAPKNKDIVAVKLAELYIADGQIEAANRLTHGVPENMMWLPVLAALREVAGDFRRCAALWMSVEQRIAVGSDDWWEARLKRVAVLHQFDPSQAIDLVEQTMVLNPNAPERFSIRLRELAKQWRENE